MKTSSNLKVISIILVIILVSLISFFGLYVKDNWKMRNLLPSYSAGMSLSGYKTAILTVDTSEKDAPHEHEEGEEHSDDEEVEKTPVNSPEILTLENFEKCKEIINTRLKLQKASEYAIRQNTADGTIVIDTINDDASDTIIQNSYERGVFEARDQATGEVLLTNSDVKSARVGYTQVSTGETYLLISITFNKEGAKKLEEITSTYTEESGQKVSLYLDTLNFDERYYTSQISNGELNVPIASNASIDLSTLEVEAKYMAKLIESEPMPIGYVIDSYGYTYSVLDKPVVTPTAITAITLFVIFTIYFVYKYKTIGLFSMLNTLGFVAILLIVIRITNSIITESGLFAIVLSTALQLLLSVQILDGMKNKSDTKIVINTKIVEFAKMILPLIIICVVFAFITWLPINSFGIITFWGIVVNLLLSMTLQKILFIALDNSSKGGKKQ